MVEAVFKKRFVQSSLKNTCFLAFVDATCIYYFAYMSEYRNCWSSVLLSPHSCSCKTGPYYSLPDQVLSPCFEHMPLPRVSVCNGFSILLNVVTVADGDYLFFSESALPPLSVSWKFIQSGIFLGQLQNSCRTGLQYVWIESPDTFLQGCGNCGHQHWPIYFKQSFVI